MPTRLTTVQMSLAITGDEEWQSVWAIRHLFGKAKQVGNSINTILLFGSDAFKSKVIEYVSQIGVKNIYDIKTGHTIFNDKGKLDNLINYGGYDNDELMLTSIFSNQENVSFWRTPIQGIVFSNSLEKFELAYKFHDFALARQVPVITIRDEVCFMYCGLIDDNKVNMALPNNNIGYEYVRRIKGQYS